MLPPEGCSAWPLITAARGEISTQILLVTCFKVLSGHLNIYQDVNPDRTLIKNPPWVSGIAFALCDVFSFCRKASKAFKGNCFSSSGVKIKNYLEKGLTHSKSHPDMCNCFSIVEVKMKVENP